MKGVEAVLFWPFDRDPTVKECLPNPKSSLRLFFWRINFHLLLRVTTHDYFTNYDSLFSLSPHALLLLFQCRRRPPPSGGFLSKPTPMSWIRFDFSLFSIHFWNRFELGFEFTVEFWDFCFWFFDSRMQFIWGLGVPEDEAEFNDVYGLDEELLEMVPKPILAVLFLFPYSSEVMILILYLCLLIFWRFWVVYFWKFRLRLKLRGKLIENCVPRVKRRWYTFAFIYIFFWCLIIHSS